MLPRTSPNELTELAREWGPRSEASEIEGLATVSEAVLGVLDRVEERTILPPLFPAVREFGRRRDSTKWRSTRAAKPT